MRKVAESKREKKKKKISIETCIIIARAIGFVSSRQTKRDEE